jgi:hypothetical protein
MTKLELIKMIRELIEPETTPDPDNMSDGELLDIIYDLVRSEEAQVKEDWIKQTNKEIREGNV